MIVADFEGETIVRSQKALEARLISIRRGSYGAFVLMHEKGGPSLSIQINKTVAYLHFFPKPDYLQHAGYYAIGTPLPDLKRDVRFRVLPQWVEQVGDAHLVIPHDRLVSVPAAVVAAKQFFKSSQRPDCVTWQES